MAGLTDEQIARCLELEGYKISRAIDSGEITVKDSWMGLDSDDVSRMDLGTLCKCHVKMLGKPVMLKIPDGGDILYGWENLGIMLGLTEESRAYEFLRRLYCDLEHKDKLRYGCLVYRLMKTINSST